MSWTSTARAGILMAVVACAALGSRSAQAEGGFRCGNGRAIRHGETEGEVRAKCGQPDAVNTWTETRHETVWQDGRPVQRDVQIAYAEWTYDLGRDRLIRYVTFEAGHLARVRTGAHGTKPPG